MGNVGVGQQWLLDVTLSIMFLHAYACMAHGEAGRALYLGEPKMVGDLPIPFPAVFTGAQIRNGCL